MSGNNASCGSVIAVGLASFVGVALGREELEEDVVSAVTFALADDSGARRSIFDASDGFVHLDIEGEGPERIELSLRDGIGRLQLDNGEGGGVGIAQRSGEMPGASIAFLEGDGYPFLIESAGGNTIMGISDRAGKNRCGMSVSVDGDARVYTNSYNSNHAVAIHPDSLYCVDGQQKSRIAMVAAKGGIAGTGIRVMGPHQGWVWLRVTGDGEPIISTRGASGNETWSTASDVNIRTREER